MKIHYFLLIVCVTLFGCGSTFNGFYKTHKNDIGATSFHVPNFMKAVISVAIPETENVFTNLADLKYIKFENIASSKRDTIINEINSITNQGYKDVFRTNEKLTTRIIAVKEADVVLTDVILFDSNVTQTSAFYLKGAFNPSVIRALTDEAAYANFTQKLIQSYNSKAEFPLKSNTIH